MDKMVVVGNIGAAFGIKGWVKINSYTAPYENILNYAKLYVRQGSSWREIEIEDSKINAAAIVVKLAGCDNRDAASLLTNKEIAVERQALAQLKKDEHYWSDLEGLEVWNLKQESLGTVEYLFNAGASDVMVVKGSDKTRYIPYILDDVVVEVNLPEGKILLDWEKEVE